MIEYLRCGQLDVLSPNQRPEYLPVPGTVERVITILLLVPPRTWRTALFEIFY